MRTYLVTYDLMRPGKDYPALFNAIKSAAAAGGWAHPLDSFWLINTGLTGAQLRDYLLRFIDRNDRIFVADVGNDWAGFGLTPAVVDWLHANDARRLKAA